MFGWFKKKNKTSISEVRAIKGLQAKTKEVNGLQSSQPQSPPADDGFLTTMMLWGTSDIFSDSSSSSSHDSGSSYDSSSGCDSGGCGGCGGGD